MTAPDAPLPPDAEALGPEADHEAVARKILLDQLTGRARSRKELADKLARKQVPARDLADWILEDCLPVRLQVQLHKVLWGNVPGR